MGMGTSTYLHYSQTAFILGNFVILGEEKVGKTFIFIVWDSVESQKLNLE